MQKAYALGIFKKNIKLNEVCAEKDVVMIMRLLKNPLEQLIVNYCESKLLKRKAFEA